MKNKCGFTLVELLAVIVIISILVMLAIPNVSKYVETSRKRAFLEDARTIVQSTKDNYLSGKYEMASTVVETPDKITYSMQGVQDTLDKKLGTGPFNSKYKDAGAVIRKVTGNYGAVRYEYYVCLIDEAGNGFDYKKIDTLNTDDIGIETGLTGCGDLPKNKYTVSVDVQNGKVAESDLSTKQVVEHESTSFNLVPNKTNTYPSVKCTNNQEGTLSGNVLTVSNVTNNTICHVAYNETITVLYNDGTLIINEKPTNRTANISTHGNGHKPIEYPALSSSNQYIFTSSSRPWYQNKDSIINVIVDEQIQPINTRYWFHDLPNLSSLNLANLDTSQTIDMAWMFAHSPSIRQLDLRNFDTSKVTDMSDMFARTYGLELLNLSSFDTSNVTNMSSMFYITGKFKTLDVSSFDTSKVMDMSHMFAASTQLEHIVLGPKFNTSKVYNFSCMFCNLSNLQELDVSGFNTSSATNMNMIFSGVSKVKNLDVSHFDTSKVTDMSGMFRNCASVESLNLRSFDTSNVTDMRDMFEHLSSVTSLDVSSFDTSKVTNMSGMFLGCSGITRLDLSNFNTSNVTNMGASNLEISSSNTAYSVGGMFQSCDNLEELILGTNFDTSKVTNMSAMFAWDKSLVTLNLRYFDTKNVTDMRGMFFKMFNVKNIYICDKLNLNKVNSSEYMFYDSVNLPNYNQSIVDKTRAHYDDDGYLKYCFR